MAVGSRPLVPSSLAPGGVLFRGHASRRIPHSRVGGFVGADQAADHRAAPRDDPAHDGPGRRWPAVATPGGDDASSGGAGGGRGQRHQHGDRPRHRSPHAPHPGAPAGDRAGGPGEADVVRLGLEVAAFALLWWQVNLLSAALALPATVFYVLVYTVWLKRTSTQNIVIGGAAGAVPVLVGWTAVTSSLAWHPGRALRRDLPVDPAALLGPGHPLRRRLPGCAASRCCPPSFPPSRPAGRCWDTRSPCGSPASCSSRCPSGRGRGDGAGLGWIYTITAVVLGAVFVVGCLGLIRSRRRSARCSSSPTRSRTCTGPLRGDGTRRPRAFRLVNPHLAGGPRRGFRPSRTDG